MFVSASSLSGCRERGSHQHVTQDNTLLLLRTCRHGTARLHGSFHTTQFRRTNRVWCLGADTEPVAAEVDQCVGSGTTAAFSVHCVTLKGNKSHRNKLHKRWSFVSCDPHSVTVTVHSAVRSAQCAVGHASQGLEWTHTAPSDSHLFRCF
jgi:hypothetical protein